MSEKIKCGNSFLSIHVGEAIIDAARQYPTLSLSVLELVQNGIDANATAVQIFIDFKKKTARVHDNGNGVSIEEFDRSLASVYHSRKDPTKMGRFGKGMVSPLGKCERFTFTSKEKGTRDPYIMWNFVTEDIRMEKECPNVPYQVRVDICQGSRFKRKDQTSVQWSTEVSMKRITTEKGVGEVDIDKLAEAIVDRFGIPMCDHNIKVDIEVIDKTGMQRKKSVTAKDFEGKPLPEWNYCDRETETETIMAFFLSKKTIKGRKGTVHVRPEEGGGYRIPFREFSKSVTEYIDSEITSALSSGVFEGEIITQAHLHPDRTKLVQDSAFLGLCCAIDAWYKEVGKQYLTELRRSKEDERYQRLGLCSMRVLEGLLHDERFADYREAVKSFKKGTIGEGHADIPDYKRQSKQAEKSISIQGKKKEGSGSANSSESKIPEAEYAGHHPLTVAGPHGRQRTTVRSSSLGLQFAYVQLGTTKKVYEFDAERGIIYFNTMNHYWCECEESDSLLMKFQEFVALQVLTLLVFREEDIRIIIEMGFEELLKAHMFALVNADRLAGRQPGRKSKK